MRVAITQQQYDVTCRTLSISKRTTLESCNPAHVRATRVETRVVEKNKTRFRTGGDIWDVAPCNVQKKRRCDNLNSRKRDMYDCFRDRFEFGGGGGEGFAAVNCFSSFWYAGRHLVLAVSVANLSKTEKARNWQVDLRLICFAPLRC